MEYFRDSLESTKPYWDKKDSVDTDWLTLLAFGVFLIALVIGGLELLGG